MVCPEEPERRLLVRETRGLSRDLAFQRKPGDGDDLEKSPRRLGQACQPGADDLFQPQAVTAGIGPRNVEKRLARPSVPNELVDEKRVAPRFARDLFGRDGAVPEIVTEEGRGELARLRGLELAHLDLFDCCRARGHAKSQKRLE